MLALFFEITLKIVRIYGICSIILWVFLYFVYITKGERMNYQFGVYTDEGRIRENNEDNYYINGITKPMEESKRIGAGESCQGPLLLAVCDGMGGEEAGEVASSIAVERMKDYEGPFSTWYRQYIEAVNKEIVSTPGTGRHMGTTLSALTVENDVVTSVNLGDSRTYLYRNGELKQLSFDHSEFELMKRAGLYKEEDYYSSNVRNGLTRSLGMPEDYGEAEPFVSEPVALMPGDKLLICSDGMCGTLRNEEMIPFLIKDAYPEDRCKEMVMHALDKGSRDNVTAIICDVMAFQS